MQLPSYVALSQQTALQRQVEVIANNLANISTPAFKSDRLIFSEFVQSAGDPADPTATMSFVREVGSVRDLRDGAIAPTGNTFDFAIQGPGYFAVQAPGGTRYTRNGTFHLDGQGRVVTVDNFPVLDSSNSPITMRTASYSFSTCSQLATISTDFS